MSIVSLAVEEDDYIEIETSDGKLRVEMDDSGGCCNRRGVELIGWTQDFLGQTVVAVVEEDEKTSEAVLQCCAYDAPEDRDEEKIYGYGVYRIETREGNRFHVVVWNITNGYYTVSFLLQFRDTQIGIYL